MIDFYTRNKPFIVLFFCYYVIEMLFYRMNGDDLTISLATKGYTPIEEIKIAINEYYRWGARILVDSILRVILHYKWFWKIANALLFSIIGKMISLLLDIKNQNEDWIIVALLFAYPQTYAMEVGWAVTSMTYVWTVSVGLMFGYCLKLLLQNDMSLKRRIALGVIATFFLIYSADIEQMALIMTVLLITVFIVNIRMKQRWIVLWYCCVSAVMLLFHLCVPGNQARAAKEMVNWFPDFTQLSLIHKVEIGISSTLNDFVFSFNIAFFLMTFLIFLAIRKKYTERGYRIVASIPFIYALFFGILKPVLSSEYEFLYIIPNIMGNYGIIDFSRCELWSAYIPLFLMLFCGVCVAWGVYLCISSNRDALFFVILLIISLGACAAIGLSPTIWASRTRTTTCFYFAIIIICCALIKEIYQLPQNKKEKRAIEIVSILTVVAGVGNFIMRLY